MVPPRGHRLLGVGGHIGNDLGELAGISLHRPEVRREEQIASQARAGHRAVDRIAEELRQIRRLFDGRAALGKSEQLAGEFLGALGGLARRGETLADDRGDFASAERERNVPEDRGQDVIEVVCDTTGDEAQGFELLGFLPLLVCALPLSHVAHDDDGAEFAAGAVANGRAARLDDAFLGVAGNQEVQGPGGSALAIGDDVLEKVLRTAPRARIHEVEHLMDEPARGVFVDPAGEALGHGVEHHDAPVVIERDTSVADRTERHGEALLLGAQRFLGALSLNV